MSDSELFTETLAAMGVAPGDPRADQFRAAADHVTAIADRFARAHREPGTPPAIVVRLGDDSVPPAILSWLARYAADFARVGHCRHGRWFKPTMLWAGEPHRAVCLQCDAYRNAQIREADQNVSALAPMACDFCGIPRDVLSLRVLAVPIASMLVRGLACPACLAPAPVPA